MITSELATQGVVVRLKRDSHIMRFISFFLGASFLTSFWTTISPRKIWAPTGTNLRRLDDYATIIRHELCHARVWKRYPLIAQFAYVFLPLPIGLAWFRWRFERAAYLIDIRAGRMTVDEVVQTLWQNYLFPWPRGAMRKSFQRALATEVSP